MLRQSVDVIIPVYGAADDLQRCLASVARHTDLERHRVILVIDGPQDEAVESVLVAHGVRRPCRRCFQPTAMPSANRGMAAIHQSGGMAAALQNPQRLGFVKSVNRGMRESSNDVVLLNSDTIVTANWLEKLIDAAYSADRIATVTPLSNNATICTITAGHDIDAFAAHVERVSQRAYPRLPTAVGFCMYIRRAALDELGLFDEAFGLGYGEENDFCMRATARGWEHVCDDATFIHHAGGRSFGKHDTRPAYATLTRKHPHYMKVIADFMRRDPLAPVRAHIGSLRIVHLVHGWPPFAQAGTELYAYWLVRQQRERHHVAVYARTEGETRELTDDGVRVRLTKNDFTTRNPLRRNALIDRAMERDFARFLREEKPDVLHVHHLAGHAFSLVRVAKRMRIPVVMQIQDWWFLCARVNRFDGVGRCSGPEPAKCARCVTLTKLPGNRALHAFRRVVARAALRAADAYIAGSHAIHADYAPYVKAPFHVIPYGVPLCGRDVRTPRRQKPIRFGLVGSSGPHKGHHIAIEAMRGINPAEATLQVFAHFEESEKPRVYASMDVLLMPSIGLESFGLAAREAMARGVPVIATSGGALDELPEADLVPPGDVDALRARIRRLIDDPSIIDDWTLPIPKSDREHAAEIERVYRTML